MLSSSIIYILVGSIVFYLVVVCEKKIFKKESNIDHMLIIRHSILVGMIILIITLFKSNKTSINVNDTISMQDIFTEQPNF